MVNLLKAISEANYSLLKINNISFALEACVKALGMNSNTDRCYIFKHTKKNSKIELNYEYEFCRTGITPYLGNQEMNGHTYDSFPGLFEQLKSNIPYYGFVNEIDNPYFKEIMQMQNIKSYLFTPIFSNNKFWGFIGFDDCFNERKWLAEEVSALQTVASNIGLRLAQEVDKNKLVNAIKNLHQYIESSGQAKWEWDITTNKVSFFYNWFGMLGYGENELDQSYLTWRKCMHPDDLNITEKKLNDFISGKSKKYEGIVRMLHKKGHIVWIKYSSKAYFNDAKKMIKLIGTHIDITDLKTKEMELKISEDKFKFIAENTADLICQLNQNGIFTYVSDSSIDIVGYHPNELIGKDIFRYYNPNELAKLKKIFKTILTNNNLTPVTYQFKKKNGDYCWLETTSKVIKDNKGNISTVQTSSRDITSRLIAQKELENALLKEKELNDLKSGFVTMASHQFRTPLTVIYSNIELLNYKTEPIKRELKNDITLISNRILDEVDRMTELMNNILIFGKYESGNLKVKIQKIEIVYFINNIIETYFSNESDSRKINLEIIGKPKKVLSDPTLLLHIINNIISNAFKYSKNKTNPILKIYFYADFFKIEVIDFGIGIPEKDLKFLFQSFYRASNTSTIKGSGLGLIIAKQFTELLNGRIKLKSIPEKKTTVTLKFPYEN
jgi:PAS domain S-box-containing protein